MLRRDRTAAVMKYVAKATRRRRENLASEILFYRAPCSAEEARV